MPYFPCIFVTFLQRFYHPDINTVTASSDSLIPRLRSYVAWVRGAWPGYEATAVTTGAIFELLLLWQIAQNNYK